MAEKEYLIDYILNNGGIEYTRDVLESYSIVHLQAIMDDMDAELNIIDDEDDIDSILSECESSNSCLYDEDIAEGDDYDY